jgi:hypothetical protein
MSDADIALRAERARAELLQKPGVLGVGFGYKVRNGVITSEHSWVVFVRQKRPLSELAPDDVIPRELHGLATDVLPAPTLRRLQCEIRDTFDILVGGILISNLKRMDANGSPVGDELGTLGFFGTLNNSSSRDNIVGLTNNHVLAANGAAVGDTVYQPKATGVSPTLNIAAADKHPIGKIEHLGKQGNHRYQYSGDPAAKDYYIDASSFRVNTNFSSCCGKNKGVKFGNLVHNLSQTALGSGTIEGIDRITAQIQAATPGEYKVYKAGEHTGWTTGKVFAAEFDWNDPNVVGKHYGTSIIIQDLGPNCGGGTKFAIGGDSGAVVVNNQRKVVGLLIGELDGLGGLYAACHIEPVLNYLGVTMVSTQHLAGADAHATSLDSELALEAADPSVALAATLRDNIVNSERGQFYHALALQHLQEVTHLVNRVRPVTVSWHRLHGPDFLAHMLNASRHADHVVPRELLGIERGAAFDQIIDVLARHGSAGLRAAIEAHRDEVRTLLDGADDISTLAACVRKRALERVS